ncbi:TPA: DUF262 domain-containing protein [Aeromonas veronii]
MKIKQTDPDIDTIFGRIERKYIDLQPDFQRDLVWNTSKKQSLIDTILREWQFPPVFLILVTDGLHEVLDGQQRLNAIHEFMTNKLRVNGNIEPFDDNIARLNGLTYEQLPQDVKRRFGLYSMRVCELYDYKEDEPYELFFRLNQGSVLTPAEKRNTLYGPVREQVRELVHEMDLKGLNIDRIGFNNSRLAYQDVISRFLYALQHRSIEKKITDQMLIDFFRYPTGVDKETYLSAKKTIDKLSSLIHEKVKLNKPTLFTWLLFINYEGAIEELFLHMNDLRGKSRSGDIGDPFQLFLIELYQDKSATSVNDAAPVKIRLLVLYLMGIHIGLNFNSENGLIAHSIYIKIVSENNPTESLLLDYMSYSNWGAL